MSINPIRIIVLTVVLGLTSLSTSAMAQRVNGYIGGQVIQKSPAPDTLMTQVKRQLARIPYYTVFDWVEAKVDPWGTVTLSGYATRPSLKVNVETRLRRAKAVKKVKNRIVVLPFSGFDNKLRRDLWDAIYVKEPALFKYSRTGSIHIVVNNGDVTLKGFVANKMDRILTEVAARHVWGVFSVKNELKID